MVFPTPVVCAISLQLLLARQLLRVAAQQFQRQGMTELTLTVTEANVRAVSLYKSEGYGIAHLFNAAVWVRNRE